MKTRIKTLAAALLVSGAVMMSCTAKDDSKIAVVDVPAVVTSSKQVQALKDEQAQKAQELAAWLEEVRAEIVNEKTQEAKDTLTKAYDNELARKRDAITKEYEKKLAEVEASISATIVEVAKSKGYTVVLAKANVLYGGEDITAEIQELVK